MLWQLQAVAAYWARTSNSEKVLKKMVDGWTFPRWPAEVLVVRFLNRGRQTMDCSKQQANCKAHVVKHVEYSKPGVDIVAHERRVTSARSAAADVVVGGEPRFADILQAEAATVVQERKDQVLISVLGGTVVPEGHRTTIWLLGPIFAHSSGGLSRLLDVTKAVVEWWMEDGTIYSTVLVQASAGTGIQ
jgi:hypothetical protein